MRSALRSAADVVMQAKDWQVFLCVHALFTALPMAPLLLGTHILAGIGLGHTYPFFALNNIHNLFSGAVFMNHMNFNGFPSFIPVGFALNPLTYLFTALLPPIDDVHWFNYVTVVAGGTLCSLFLRRLHVSRAGALMGGACFVAGNWWLVVTADYIPAFPLFPLIGFVLHESLKHPKRAALFGALLSGYIWLGVNTQVSFMLFTAFGAGALALAVRARKQGLRAVLQPLLVLATSVGVGTVIGIPKFIPTYVYGNLSWRAGGMAVSTATASGLKPLTAFTYLFPYISFPFVNFGGELLQVYIGAFGLALLIVALVMACSRHASATLRWWAAAYVLVLVLAFDHSPLAALLHSFPPFSYFRGAGRWTMLASFAVAPAIGFAFDALMHGKLESLRKKLAFGFGWLATLLCAAFVAGQVVLMLFTERLIDLFQGYFAFFHDVLRLAPPLSYYDAFVEKRLHELAAHPLVLQPQAFFPLLSIVLLALMLRTDVRKKLRHVDAVFVACGLLTTSLTLLFYSNYLLPRAPLTAQNPVAEFLREHPGMALGLFSNGTFAELAPGHRLSQADDLEWTFTHLIPNTNMLFGVRTLDYFDNIAARRPSAMATWVGAEWLPTPDAVRLVAMKGTTEEKIAEFARRQDVLNVQGVRYLVSSFPLPEPQFQKVFETTITSAEVPVMIYENPDVRPLAYFAEATVTMPEQEEEALQTMFGNAWPQTTSLVECEQNCPLQDADGTGRIEMIAEQPQAWSFVTTTEAPQWMIVTLNRLPGWQVFVDGEETPNFYANAAHFAIPVPAGTHTVELRFSVLHLIASGLRDLLFARS